MPMRWRAVVSALVVVQLLSCRSTSSQLSLQQLDAFCHHGTQELFDTLTLSFYPDYFFPLVPGDTAAHVGTKKLGSVYGGAATVRVHRHAILKDSAETTSSLERKASQKKVISSVTTTTAESTFTWLYTLFLGSLGLLLLYFLIRKL